MDETLKLRCPECKAIDWSRDGFRIAMDPTTGQLVRRRIAPSGSSDVHEAAWSCAQCGHGLFGGTTIAGALHALRIAHLE
jgi:hypothetical protein